MQQPDVLTKFTKYYPNSFELGSKKAIKMSLASEFNDLFDSKIFLSDEEVKKYAKEYNFTEKHVDYIVQKINNVIHIVSFIGKRANQIETTNMWGIYANSGKGIAVEFDYAELDDRANQTSLNELINTFNKFDNEIYQNSLFSEEQIKQCILNKKINFCKTKVGCKALKHLYSAVKNTHCGGKIDISSFNLRSETEARETVTFVNQFVNSVKSHLAINNKFLLRVSYTPDTSYLLSAFEANLKQTQWLYSAKLPETNMYKTLNELARSFVTTKSIVWQHENEYRLVTAFYTHQDFLKPVASQSVEKSIECLQKFKCKNKSEPYFYAYSDEAFSRSDDDIGGNGGVSLINLPFPKKIYLGWDFQEDETAINKIKEFCEYHNVELFKLKPYFNYETGEFITEKLL